MHIGVALGVYRKDLLENYLHFSVAYLCCVALLPLFLSKKELIQFNSLTVASPVTRPSIAHAPRLFGISLWLNILIDYLEVWGLKPSRALCSFATIVKNDVAKLSMFFFLSASVVHKIFFEWILTLKLKEYKRIVI